MAIAGNQDNKSKVRCRGCGEMVRVKRPIVDGKYGEPEAPKSCNSDKCKALKKEALRKKNKSKDKKRR